MDRVMLDPGGPGVGEVASAEAVDFLASAGVEI